MTDPKRTIDAARKERTAIYNMGVVIGFLIATTIFITAYLMGWVTVP